MAAAFFIDGLTARSLQRRFFQHSTARHALFAPPSIQFAARFAE
jgi:hypothetical protein